MVTLNKPAAGDTEWATEVNDNWTTIENDLNLLTTKGDLLVRDNTSRVRLPVGADGLVLVADSSQTCGVKWGAGGVTDHGALTGLLDDDHTQYPLLAGRGGAPAVTNAEFGYLAGVTSSIQTQLGARPTGTGTINRLAYWTGADTIDDLAAIAANRILVSDANGLPVANATLTATRVPFADASGLLTDSAHLAFDANALAIGTGINSIRYTAGGSTVWNETGLDIDFRVEGVGDQYALWNDASIPRLYVGTNTLPPTGSTPRMVVKSIGYGAGEDHYALQVWTQPGGVARRVGGLGAYAVVVNGAIPTTEMNGLVGVAESQLTSGNTLGTAYGLRFAVYQNGTGTITTAYGVYAGCYNYATAGAMTAAYGGYFYVNADAGQVVTATGIRIQLAGGNGLGITGNNYGIYIAAPTGTVPGNRWGIYQEDPAARNHFFGCMRIGTATDAVAGQADLSVGLAGAARSFYDQSAADQVWYSAANVLGVGIYGDEYELGFADAAANASGAGRLRRNGNFLTWHNGTSGQSILTQHLATAKGDLLVATAANALAALAVGATDGRPLIVKAAAGAGVAWCGVGELARDAYPDFVASGASHAKGAVPDPGASAGTTKFLREDATWAVPGGATSKSTLGWGAATVGANQSMVRWADSTATSALTDAVDARIIIRYAGTLRNLAITLTGAPGAGKSITFTVRVNGTNTGITVTISDAATTGTDTTHTQAVSADDVVEIARTAGTISRSGVAELELDAT